MEHRRLGATDRTVSVLGLGTWTFAGDAIWGDSEEASCVRVVHAALERGITLFDSAPNYGDGRSEEILGRALAAVAPASRDNITVASKFKIEGMSESELRKAVLASSRRLRRDRIDLMQIHWPGTSPEETRRAVDLLFRLREQGLVGEVGACNFGVFDIEDTIDFPIVSNQIPYNLLWRAVEGREGIAARSRAVGRTTIAYSVLQQGLLTGKYPDLATFPSGRKRTRHFGPEWPGTRHTERGFEAETATALAALTALSSQWDRDLLNLALGFVTTAPDIDVTLIGARTEEQLLKSCIAAESPLSEEERRSLEEATDVLRRALGGHADMYDTESRIRYPDASGAPVRSG